MFVAGVERLTYLSLRLLSVILPFLHGDGHLVHGRDDGAAGLTQKLWTFHALGAADLQEENGIKGFDSC